MIAWVTSKLQDKIKQGVHSTICGVVKRYAVLHPYPLHSVWRSSPGQIRNFPVDATAS